MARYAVGAKIKPRLSNRYLDALSVSEQITARKIIRQLKRADTQGHDATDYPNGVYLRAGKRVRLRVRHGSVLINGRSTRVETSSATVADTVCAAVCRGLFTDPPGSPDDVPDGDGEGDGEGEGGEQPDGGQPDGEGQPDGDGDGEGDGEGEASPDESGEGEGEGGADGQPPEPPSPETDLERLKRRLDEIAAYLNGPDAEHGDKVSNLPYKHGAMMLAAGIPVEGILHAYALNWPDTARAAAGIEPWSPADFGEHQPGQHELYPYVRALIEANVPVMLIGPTQAGKSFAVEQVAADMGLDFRACPLTGGASSSWLLGAWTPQGFVEAGFPQVYGEGGVFLFDEVDAADPNMIVVLNNALANGALENPRNGKVIKRHPRTRLVAAANTFGGGATAEYTGRARQDAALLERFRMGRILVSYDRDLQHRLADHAYETALESLTSPEGE